LEVDLVIVRLCALLCLLGISSVLHYPAHAADESDLLPVDQAFAVSTDGSTQAALKIRFAIADGYYLYRHRFAVAAVDKSQSLPALSIPDGTKKVDEFFGAVETYRQSVELNQALTGVTADSIDIELRFQGCADIGICYPPQKRQLTIALASAPASASPLGLPSATAPSLSFGATTSGLPGSTDPQNALPEDQAFLFEAIATSSDSVLARFTIAPGYYLYRDKTKFSVEPSEYRLQAPQWPAAKPHEDGHFGQVMVYFESIEVPIALEHSEKPSQDIQLKVEYQGCKDQGICYPIMRRTLSLSVPAGMGATAVINSAMNASSGAGAIDPVVPAATMGLAAALLAALLGGLVLNLMPCVLPILSLKAMSLAKSGHSSAYARRNALWYTAGVLVSFAVLGLAILSLRAGGAALGWGFQLQQPAFVGLLVYVMLALGLSMSGLIAFGSGMSGVGQSLTEGEGAKSAFFTGVLACIVASPCTAPFMGGALAYAIAQPAAIALSIFLTLGLGLALPFLLIGFVPALARSLPRPGAWMETFKQALAFPMYLTGVWLLWVLGNQIGIDGAGAVLAGCVLLAMSLWWWERQREAGTFKRGAFALVLLILALLPLYFVGGLNATARSGASLIDSHAEVFSDSRLAALQLEGRPVFVNMTADWCATCKVNERLVLSTDTFKAALAKANASYLKGDWTNEDPVISAFLDRFHAVGVPLYVVFPANGDQPQILPALLTSSIVTDALANASAKPAR